MKTRLKKTTISTKRNIFEQHLTPYLKNVKVNEITPITVRLWQNEILKKDLAPTYQKSIHNQLSAIMNYAVKYYNIPNNPCRVTGSIGKKKTNEMQFWTLDEYKTALEYEKKPAARVALEVLFWSGIREGELLALTPADITENNDKVKIIRVTKTFSHVDGEDLVTTPKTEGSVREVTIPKFLYDEIQEYVSKLYGIKPNDKLFYFSAGYIGKEIKQCSQLSGVKEIRTHDLRHSHAALLINLEVDIVLLSKRLGHEDIETTINTYGHLYPNKQNTVATKLENLK